MSECKTEGKDFKEDDDEDDLEEPDLKVHVREKERDTSALLSEQYGRRHDRVYKNVRAAVAGRMLLCAQKTTRRDPQRSRDCAVLRHSEHFSLRGAHVTGVCCGVFVTNRSTRR